jgi:hypothetical protein
MGNDTVDVERLKWCKINIHRVVIQQIDIRGVTGANKNEIS